MKGKVYLVGAGPGDYKLITLKGMEVIKKADAIVYDRLINYKYLNEAKKDCELIYVGKKPDNHTFTQDEINEVLVKKANEGKMVVRLKGGDPYVYGRGGEECEVLLENKIEFEVVPGITSVIGGLCYGGIPITHRNFSSSFHVFTGHTKDDEELDYEIISKLNGTLVFVMGMSNLDNIVSNLIKYGKNKFTPVGIINYATRSNQKVVVGNLENIYQKVIEENISSPSLIVIGNVVKLRDKLSFFENKPLFGKNIIVTRSRAQNSSLVEKIADLGGNPIEFPTIKIEEIKNNNELDLEINNIKNYSYIIFSSVNSINIFFENLYKLGYDSRILNNIKIVAIGKSTNDTLKNYGIYADIIPNNFNSEGIVELLKSKLNKNDNILIPRGDKAKNYLINELENVCNIKEVILYETLIDENEDIIKYLNKNKVDYITFTSSSTVDNFIKIIGGENLNLLDNINIVSIGPVTTKTIIENSLKVYSECEESTIDGIINTLLKHKED